ncbi:hypothetical protein O181_053994 [Austropuccinia psidii MF-1]|uniref:Uncharacterized protein n=1 Tax=Austropuccinia psidii MF-1 TaxID=1389203 RepID=A0A9Q3E3Q8_9BASI|nr:hypothetical protein [Austropuccinia psidii MF-1]
MDKINEANFNIAKLSTPFSHIRRPVKPKEKISSFITELIHRDNNQVLMKEAPQLKEWPPFTGEEHALRRRSIEPCSTEEYINSLEVIVTRTKIGRALRKVDIKSPKKPFIKKYKPREAFKPNTPNSNEQRKCNKCGGIGHLANNSLKKVKINEIVEIYNNNDKDEESDSENNTEELGTSASDEININNAQTSNIDLIYEVLDVNSSLPQVGTSDTSLKNIQDGKLYRTKPVKGVGYTAGKSSIRIFMVYNKEEKLNLDTGAYCTCVGRNYLESIVPYWERKLIPIPGVKFSSASESMKPLRIIDLTLIFPHPSQCITNYSHKKEDKIPAKDFFIGDQLKAAEFNQELTEKIKEKQIYLLFKYKNAFATEKKPLGAIIGNEVDIILNIENPYPPLLRRPAYPATPTAIETLEVHIKELMDL